GPSAQPYPAAVASSVMPSPPYSASVAPPRSPTRTSRACKRATDAASRPAAAHAATARPTAAARSASADSGGGHASSRPPAAPSGFHASTRKKSVPRPKVVTRSPASKTPSPLVSSDQTALPSGAGRITPILVLPSLVQLPTTNVSVLWPKWYTLSPEAVCSV